MEPPVTSRPVVSQILVEDLTRTEPLRKKRMSMR